MCQPIMDGEKLLGVNYFCWQMQLSPRTVARMMPAERSGTRRLVLSEGLFALPPMHQEVTILHELLHLAIWRGALADRSRCELPLRAHYSPPGTSMWPDNPRRQDKGTFRQQRHAVAFYFFLFPDEIMAECALRDGYGNRLTERLRQHIAMRNDCLNGDAHHSAHHQIRRYWLTLELQRAEMMIRLAEPGEEKTQLEAICDRYRVLLGAAVDAAEHDRLLEFVARMLAYEPGDPDAEAAHDEMFAEIIRLPYEAPLETA